MNIRELFFKEAVTENRGINNDDIKKLIKYLNNAGDEGTQFDAKDVRKILNRKKKLALDKVKTELSKHISAMANTSGGFLAIGISEGKNRSKPFKVSAFNLNDFNLQDIQRAISTSVEPKVEFTLESVVTRRVGAKNYGIILIFIEQSMHPPHQVVHNRTYYFRHGESSNPAPHSLVTALFNYRKKPILKLQLIKVKNPKIQRILVKNSGNASALHTQIIINIYPKPKKGTKSLITKQLIDNTTDGLWTLKTFLGTTKKNFMKFRFRAKPSQILLPGLNEILFDIPIINKKDIKLTADIYCEGFEGHQEFELY